MKRLSLHIILGAAAIAVAAVIGANAQADAHEDWDVGVQTYSFRNFTLFEAIDQARAMGLTAIEPYPGQQLSPDHDTTVGPGLNDEERDALRAKLESAGAELVAFGVVGLSGSEDDLRPFFEFAADMDIPILTANPDADSFDALDELVEEYDIKVALHNHGPGARYDSVEDTLEAVEGRHANIGACLDTGHAIRSGENPDEVVEALGDRVHMLHLKDWELDGSETIVGEGDADLHALASALDAVGFDGPINLEYELHADWPAPHMAIGTFNWRLAVLEALAG
ncbi:MAG: sugar phosphate isomerase/epimerase family protein [Candidatus Hydrogenedentota bacterium]